MGLTVSQVARTSGVTVRTLHHYDEIGLLSPSSRSAAGYRLYLDPDLERLQEILFYRELGFALDEIRGMAERPDHNREAALRHQRALLSSRVTHLEAMIDAVDAALEAERSGFKMSKEEMFEVFGDFDPKAYEEEVEERWSGPLLAESKRRTGRYGKEQWKAIKAEEKEIGDAFAASLASGADPASAEARAVAERHRLHIDRWFYPCPHPMHAGLAQMYVADARFAAYWEKFGPCLADFVKDAIEANAAAAEG